MRAVLLVDGMSEYRGLPLLLRRTRGLAHRVVKTLYVPLQPGGPVNQNAILCASRIRLVGATVQLAIVIIDRETSVVAASRLASDLESAIRAGTNIEVAVVVKDRKLENWLVADPEAIRESLRGRFVLSAADERAILGDAADTANAEAILKRAAIKDAYSKVPDAQRILRVTDPLRMGANSRSFRRFLRVLGHRAHRDHSCTPSV